MATIAITLSRPINQSCQIGDTAYFIKVNQSVGGFQVPQDNANMIEIGMIKSIGIQSVDYTIVCDLVDPSNSIPSESDFIFFAKNRSVNEASMVGYYSKFKFMNNSYQKAELFSAACEISESSK